MHLQVIAQRIHDGALIMMATSVAPATILKSFVAMADGSLGSMNAISETLTASIPLVMAGLGIGLAFRAGLFNIGAEGQMVVGGLATAIAAFSFTGLPMILHLPLALLIRMSVGAVYAAIAGVLRATTGAHEVISTIMLNLISFRLLDYMLVPIAANSCRNTIGLNCPMRFWEMREKMRH